MSGSRWNHSSYTIIANLLIWPHIHFDLWVVFVRLSFLETVIWKILNTLQQLIVLCYYILQSLSEV
jgi:hypothetical protein